MEYSCIAYVMFGMPGAGKSTWIKNNLGDNVKIVSRDIIRANIGISSSVDDKKVGTHWQEQEVTEKENGLIEYYCKSGQNFVVDDMNTSKYRNDLIKLLRKNDAKIIAVRLNTPLDVCIKRRNGQIDESIMRQIYGRVKPLNESEYDEIINVDYNEN